MTSLFFLVEDTVVGFEFQRSEFFEGAQFLEVQIFLCD